MYRNSQLIRANILVGERLVYVNDRGFRQGDNVRLIHAPSYLRTTVGDSAGFYYEDFTIANVRRNPTTINAAFEIELNAGVANHYRTDLAIAGVELGDALVNLDRNPQRHPDPMFRINTAYIRTAFWYAFTDLLELPSNGVGMPLYDGMNNAGMVFAGGKWFAAKKSAVVPSNTGLAVAAATRDPLTGNQFSLGTTTNGGPYSYVWRANIDEAVRGPRHRFPLTFGHNPDLMSGEVLVHELAHQWNVNATYPDHECTHPSYDNPSCSARATGRRTAGNMTTDITRFTTSARRRPPRTAST